MFEYGSFSPPTLFRQMGRTVGFVFEPIYRRELGKCFSRDLNVETGFLQLSFDLGRRGGLNDIFPEEGLPSFHAQCALHTQFQSS